MAGGWINGGPGVPGTVRVRVTGRLVRSKLRDRDRGFRPRLRLGLKRSLRVSRRRGGGAHRGHPVVGAVVVWQGAVGVLISVRMVGGRVHICSIVLQVNVEMRKSCPLIFASSKQARGQRSRDDEDEEVTGLPVAALCCP